MCKAEKCLCCAAGGAVTSGQLDGAAGAEGGL